MTPPHAAGAELDGLDPTVGGHPADGRLVEPERRRDLPDREDERCRSLMRLHLKYKGPL
jgi:hypothetical protein